MATRGERREHVAFMDSRGDGIAGKMKNFSIKEPFRIRINSGATLNVLVNEVDLFLRDHPFHVAYIVGGACDITTKIKGSSAISFNWKPAGGLGPHLVTVLKDADKRLKTNHPASKVIFCPLVGVDLARVVNMHPIHDYQQEAVNDAIFEYNMEVFSINNKRATYSPSLHRTVHRSNKGKRKSHYHHLRDGIHLQDYLKESWAEEFSKAININ